MRRDAPRIGVEVLLLGVILAVLGAGLGLIIQAQSRIVSKPVATVPAMIIAEKKAEPTLLVEPPSPVPLDLTPDRLRPIEASIAKEKARAAEQSRRAVEFLEAANRALDEARKSRVEEIRARKQVDSGESIALQAEDRRDQYARERDVLAEKRDDARAAIERQRLRSRDGVAVLPYKGPNGTWRRPIAIECRGDKATLQPGGPSFSMDEMTSFPNARRSPLVYAVAKAMLRARSTRTPDGAASVPYLMFVVRPDGIRPYYAARTLLEPLGITYGYELADANWDIEFPDLDDPAEWTEIPGAQPASAWPPPASEEAVAGTGLSAKGSRQASGIGTSVAGNMDRFATGGSNGGPRAVGALQRVPASGSGRTGAPGSAAQTASRGPIPALTGSAGPGDGDRPLASPGDGRGQVGVGSVPSPWSRPSRGSGDSFDMAELERLGSGNTGLKPVPRDGRVPWQPGRVPAPASPSFLPTPPSGSGASMSGGEPRTPPGGAISSIGGTSDSSGSPLAAGESRSPYAATPSAGSRTGSPVTTAVGGGTPSSVVGQPSSVASSNVYREAIARHNGLVAPTAPGSSGRSSNAADQVAPSGGGANSASASGGSPGGGGGSSGGSPGGRPGSGRDPFASQSFPIVVSCDRAGLTIHPGGETIAFDVVSRDDTILPAKLRALVKSKQDAEPEIGLRPRVKFLVKPGGEVTYLKARWQATTATSYPTTWQLVDRGGPRLPDLETR